MSKIIMLSLSGKVRNYEIDDTKPPSSTVLWTSAKSTKIIRYFHTFTLVDKVVGTTITVPFTGTLFIVVRNIIGTGNAFYSLNGAAKVMIGTCYYNKILNHFMSVTTGNRLTFTASNEATFDLLEL